MADIETLGAELDAIEDGCAEFIEDRDCGCAAYHTDDCREARDEIRSRRFCAEQNYYGAVRATWLAKVKALADSPTTKSQVIEAHSAYVAARDRLAKVHSLGPTFFSTREQCDAAAIAEGTEEIFHETFRKCLAKDDQWLNSARAQDFYLLCNERSAGLEDDDHALDCYAVMTERHLAEVDKLRKRKQAPTTNEGIKLRDAWSRAWGHLHRVRETPEFYSHREIHEAMADYAVADSNFRFANIRFNKNQREARANKAAAGGVRIHHRRKLKVRHL